MGYIEKKVLSTDGVHHLSGRVYLPEGEAKGYFHVVHGMTEHIARYDRFMQEMAADGYICFGYDHLGHGKTVNSSEEWGFIAHKDGWKHLCRDVGVFADAVREAYPLSDGVSYILMGHSMGSFIVRVAVAEFGIRPSKLIVMGTGGPNPMAGIGLCLMRLVKRCKGERYVSKTIRAMAFGSYNDRFREEKDGRAWLTNDREIRRMYAEDPMCMFQFSISAMMDLVTLNKRANTRRWSVSMPISVPVLLVAGREDPVGNYGKGVARVYKTLQKRGISVRMHLYDGARHEILNDVSRNEVINDIRRFVG